MNDSLDLRDIVVERRRRSREQHRKTHLFNGLSLRVDDGEIVAVAGPEGFGGTTLARLVAGVAAPDSGRILINGVDMTDTPADRRPVGLIGLGGGLLPQLTAEENITYGLRLRGEPRVFVRHRRDDVAKALELLPSLALRPHQLSAGQRIRVSLGRAMAGSAHTIAIDATAGSEGLGQLRDLVGRARRMATSVVMVATHDPTVVGQADRVVVIRDGRAGPAGSPAQLRAAPPDLVTARLVLTDPVTELTGVVSDGRLLLSWLRLPCPPGVPDGRRVTALFTATAVEIGPAPPAVSPVPLSTTMDAHSSISDDKLDPGRESAPDGAGPEWIPGRITTVDWVAGSPRVRAELLESPSLRLPAHPVTGDRPRSGDRVGLRVDPARLFIYDRDAEPYRLLAGPGARR